MHLDKWFGDSYDIVKQSLLRWLAPCGAWKAHPMFTPPVDPRRAEDFARFLGVPLVSTKTLNEHSGRDAFLAPARSCVDHLFLDPDTGLRIGKSRATPQHLLGEELVAIAKARKDKLTLVFDQSLDRRRKVREEIKEKLSWLADEKVHGVAYESHACFILVSSDKQVLANAVRTLLKESRLPRDRLVPARSLP